MDDIFKADVLMHKAGELLGVAGGLAEEAGFPARLDSARFTLDGRRLTIAFTSESRVEHREFARSASDKLGLRVDLSQLGARDRSRVAGGYGICGRELCCSNWLSTFPAISIRMAKDQELSLNPQKISGLCGRLLCCLSYEEEGYKEMRRTLPKMGHRCSTPTGEGKVVGINILQRRITLLVDRQRVEVGDSDLGLVVRWDPSSKAAEPPPSLTTTEAVAAGLITEEEAEERERIAEAEVRTDWLDDALTAPARPELPSREREPKKEESEASSPRSGRGRGRRRGGRQQGSGKQATAQIEGARSRTFKRRGSARTSGLAEPSAGSAAGSTPPPGKSDSSAGESRGQSQPRGRRRRGRRGRGSRGNQGPPAGQSD